MLSCNGSLYKKEKIYSEYKKLREKGQIVRHKISDLSIKYANLVFLNKEDLHPVPEFKMLILHHKFVKTYNKDFNSLFKNYARKIDTVNAKKYLVKVDSLFTLMTKNDKENLKGVIKFVKKYGYPDKELVGDNNSGGIRLILSHYDNNESFKELLKKELEGKCSQSDFRRIMEEVTPKLNK